MDEAYLPYVVCDAFCILYTATIFFRLKSEIGDERDLVCLKKMILAFVIMVVTDMLWIIVENSGLRKWHFLDAAVNGISVSAVAVGCFFWFEFLELRLNSGWFRDARFKWPIRMPMIAACTLDLLSAFTGWVFYISADGTYEEGRLFWVQGTVTFAYLLLPAGQAAWKTVRTPLREKRWEYISYVVYICACIGAVLAEDSLPTVPLFTLSIFAVIQMLFLTLYLDQEYELARRERELAESRTAMMLSQIQPHFLFNSLTAIAMLCDLDPAEAKKTTLNFSEFLRGNLDSLSQKQPVPFSAELRHTQTYANIEKVRFGDKLNVVYDIQTEDFLLPSLTVQPLVENAVKYGVGKKVEGGTVRLSARGDESGWYVTVTDDGVGFDPAQIQSSGGRSHIGIVNVRRRLALQSGGTLRIESVLGQGTVAEIYLPKEGVPHDDPMHRR